MDLAGLGITDEAPMVAPAGVYQVRAARGRGGGGRACVQGSSSSAGRIDTHRLLWGPRAPASCPPPKMCFRESRAPTTDALHEAIDARALHEPNEEGTTKTTTTTTMSDERRPTTELTKTSAFSFSLFHFAPFLRTQQKNKNNKQNAHRFACEWWRRETCQPSRRSACISP